MPSQVAAQLEIWPSFHERHELCYVDIGMSDMIAWLDGWGLGQLGLAFGRPGHRPPHVRHLTEDDLKELGLTIGLRRRLMHAIEEGLRRPAAELAIARGRKACGEREPGRRATAIDDPVFGPGSVDRTLVAVGPGGDGRPSPRLSGVLHRRDRTEWRPDHAVQRRRDTGVFLLPTGARGRCRTRRSCSARHRARRPAPAPARRHRAERAHRDRHRPGAGRRD